MIQKYNLNTTDFLIKRGLWDAKQISENYLIDKKIRGFLKSKSSNLRYLVNKKYV